MRENKTTRFESDASTDESEHCDRCSKPTCEGDGRTEALLDGGVFCSPKCAQCEAGTNEHLRMPTGNAQGRPSVTRARPTAFAHSAPHF